MLSIVLVLVILALCAALAVVAFAHLVLEMLGVYFYIEINDQALVIGDVLKYDQDVARAMQQHPAGKGRVINSWEPPHTRTPHPYPHERGGCGVMCAPHSNRARDVWGRGPSQHALVALQIF